MTTHQHADTDGRSGTDLPVRLDWTESGTPVTAVTEALAVATGQRVEDIDPLHGSVDADGLNALVRSSDTSIYISFVHEGLSVSVTGSGAVTVEAAPGRPADGPSS